MSYFEKIISGGQTGADRAALDFAIEHGIPHGGFCPRERRAEDGKIPARYNLVETTYPLYSEAAECNVRNSDGTVVFTIGAELSSGSRKSLFLAQALHKPVLRIWREYNEVSPEKSLARFLQENAIKVLNVSGPRGSKEPEVYGFVMQVLKEALELLPNI